MNTPLIEYAREGRTLKDLPIFDAHAHLGKWAGFDPVQLEDHINEMDRIGIDVTAVSSLLALSGEIQRGNDRVAEAMARYPGRFIGYAHVSAAYQESMIPELDRCFANPGFKGIKLYQVGVQYDDRVYDPVYAFARDHNAPVLADTWGGDLVGLEKAAERHPEVAFFAAHAGSAFAYEEYMRKAKDLPNLYLDLTYSREHTNMIEYFVETLGADRIIWGSDVPLFSMAHQISKVLFARIPDEDKRKILYYTAARLFGLSC